jgi:hypothetical protein
VVKSEKFEGGLRMILKVKHIPEVIESVEGLEMWNTEIRKLTKKRTFEFFSSSSVVFSGISSSTKLKYGALHTLYLIYGVSV